MSKQKSYADIRNKLIDELVDVGELIPKGDELFEDMGGHLVHERNLDSYITNHLEHLPAEELAVLIDRISGEK